MKPGVKPGSERFNIHTWDELRAALAVMKPQSKLYEIVKDELTKRSRWKAAPRGVTMKKGEDPRRHKLN